MGCILQKPFFYMNRFGSLFILLVVLATGCKQKDKPAGPKENTLLWKVSGNGLEKPSYIYGTVHIICKDDASLSENFKSIISKSDVVYFEVDLDNIKEMMSAIDLMKMKGDTTLKELLSEEDFDKVKRYVDEESTLLPFSELESYLPILTATMLSEKMSDCDESTGIEEEITKLAKKSKKETLGVETLEYQLGLMDSIPYIEQAKALVAFVDSMTRPNGEKIEKEKMDSFYELYKEQDLEALNKMILEMDPTFVSSFADLLLYNRNRNWVIKLKDLMKKNSLVLAVGAGHLPGEKGLLNLLRKEGYEVTPLENKISH